MSNQMSQNLSWFRQPAVSNYLTTDTSRPEGPLLQHLAVDYPGRERSAERLSLARVLPVRLGCADEQEACFL